MPGGWQENWRWSADSYYTKHQTIGVIEPPDAAKPGKKGVPFGFSRALAPETGETVRYLEEIERNGWEIP